MKIEYIKKLLIYSINNLINLMVNCGRHCTTIYHPGVDEMYELILALHRLNLHLDAYCLELIFNFLTDVENRCYVCGKSMNYSPPKTCLRIKLGFINLMTCRDINIL
jgi:hypothetical protein